MGPSFYQWTDNFPEGAEIWLQEKSACLYDINLTLYKEEYIKSLNLLNTFSDYKNAILWTEPDNYIVQWFGLYFVANLLGNDISSSLGHLQYHPWILILPSKEVASNYFLS